MLDPCYAPLFQERSLVLVRLSAYLRHLVLCFRNLFYEYAREPNDWKLPASRDSDYTVFRPFQARLRDRARPQPLYQFLMNGLQSQEPRPMPRVPSPADGLRNLMRSMSHDEMRNLEDRKEQQQKQMEGRDQDRGVVIFTVVQCWFIIRA